MFTDLVGFSAWALRAGDAVALELLREVGIAVEEPILDQRGRIVKRLGDGVMATFLDARNAVDAALDAQAAVDRIEIEGWHPRMRAGCIGVRRAAGQLDQAAGRPRSRAAPHRLPSGCSFSCTRPIVRTSAPWWCYLGRLHPQQDRRC